LVLAVLAAFCPAVELACRAETQHLQGPRPSAVVVLAQATRKARRVVRLAVVLEAVLVAGNRPQMTPAPPPVLRPADKGTLAEMVRVLATRPAAAVVVQSRQEPQRLAVLLAVAAQAQQSA
jgi:hypothetical protein